MPDLREQYDDAMFDYSLGDYDSAIAKLSVLLQADPEFFDAQLSLGMAYYRKGDYGRAIEEGHKAEKMKPKEQLVHTNLSLFYMKNGDKKTAEHHGLQARVAGWRENMAPPDPNKKDDDELKLAAPPAPKIPPPDQFPDMPWRKKPKL